MKLKRGSKKLWLRIGLGVAILIVAFAATLGIYTLVSDKTNEPEIAVEQAPATPKPVSIQSNTLFMGDVYWGRYMNDWAMKSDLKTAYPFARLNEFNKEAYTAWVANLECPTVAGFSQTSAQENTTLSFNCSPDYLPEAAKWFDIVSLVNNHSDNRGVDGFAETKQQ
ncbi:hypothetical protein B7Z17_03295, partial [Candidatus Saccharibacteria bacterium 32-49-10]